MNNEAQQHFQTDLSVGEILRRTRLHYGQSLADIERALRIRAVQLEALETGNYGQLPGRVYVIGFIRSYSEYLGLDGEKMVQLFKTQAGGKSVPAASLNFPATADDTKIPQFWHIGLSVGAVIIILIAWWSFQGGDRKIVTDVPSVAQAQPEIAPTETTQAPEAPVQDPALADQSGLPQPAPMQNGDAAPGAGAIATVAAAPTEATAPAAVPAKKGVILIIKTNSWVEIRGKDGKSVVSRVLQAGDRYFVPDRPDLTISLGNSGGVELEVEGKKLKPLGAVGEVKRNIPLDIASLKKNYGT